MAVLTQQEFRNVLAKKVEAYKNKKSVFSG